MDTKLIEPGIRLAVWPETDNYEDVYGRIEDAEERKALYELIDNDGCYLVSSQFQCPCCDEWITADSIGMIIGNPFEPSNNCYIPDLVAQAKHEREKAIAKVKSIA